MEDDQFQQETVAPLPPPTPATYPSSHYGGIPGTPFPMGLGPVTLPVMSAERVAKPIRPTPTLPPSSKMANLNLKDKATSSSSIEPFPLSLKLQSSAPSEDHSPESSSHSSSSASSSALKTMAAGKYNGGGGDSIISVA